MRKYELLYIIGGSNSIAYFPYLVRSLGQAYTVMHAPGNSRSSALIVQNLDDWLAGYDPDVAMFNCGTHDLTRNPEFVTTLEQYEANLRRIVARLQGLPGPPRLIWCTSMPVLDELHQATHTAVRLNEDVIAYNKCADVVMAEMGVESLDLYRAVMSNDPHALMAADGIHFQTEGYRFLAQTITDYMFNKKRGYHAQV